MESKKVETKRCEEVEYWWAFPERKKGNDISHTHIFLKQASKSVNRMTPSPSVHISSRAFLFPCTFDYSRQGIWREQKLSEDESSWWKSELKLTKVNMSIRDNNLHNLTHICQPTYPLATCVLAICNYSYSK